MSRLYADQRIPPTKTLLWRDGRHPGDLVPPMFNVNDAKSHNLSLFEENRDRRSSFPPRRDKIGEERASNK